MDFYISDMHFDHANIIRMCDRPYSNVAEMNEILIRNWNARVTNADTVYIVGDMFFGKLTADGVMGILSQLKGRKHLIKGNHDDGWIKMLERENITLCTGAGSKGIFESISDMQTIQTYWGKVVLCHYPLMAYKGKWQIHGHIHGNTHMRYWPLLEEMDRTLNASVEINGYQPVSFEELVENNWRFKEQVYQSTRPGNQYRIAMDMLRKEIESGGPARVCDIFRLADFDAVNIEYQSRMDRPAWATEEKLALDKSGNAARKWALMQNRAKLKLRMTYRNMLKLGETLGDAPSLYTVCVTKRLDDYRDHDDILRDIECGAVSSDGEQHIRSIDADRADAAYDVFAIRPDTRVQYGIELVAWKEQLSYNVLKKSIAKYGITTVTAAIFYEMTFCGLDESAIKKERESLTEIDGEIERGEIEKGISWEELKEDLFGKLTDEQKRAMEPTALELEYRDAARKGNIGIVNDMLADYSSEHWNDVPDDAPPWQIFGRKVLLPSEDE